MPKARPLAMRNLDKHLGDVPEIKEKQERLMKILRNPELFNLVTINEFDKTIVGEIQNRQTIFLLCCGIWVQNNQVASYNLNVNSESGSGKDYITKHVIEIFPKEFVESRTRITQHAFTYWHNSKKEPEWTWDGKICYLQDVSDSILNSEVFKVMVSDGSYATVVKDQNAIDLKIEGKPVIPITTAVVEPKSEMARRFPIINLDESVNQTKAIMNRQSRNAEIGLKFKTEYDPDIIDAFRLLQRVPVIIPYAETIQNGYPSDHIIMRTHYQRLLDLIKASAALHQFQRETDEDNYIVAEPKDYDFARIAMIQMTQNAQFIPLTRNKRKFLEFCKEFDGPFTAKEAATKYKFAGTTTVYTYLNDLQKDFLSVDSKKLENTDKPVKVYTVLPTIKINIPTFKECQNIENSETGKITEISEITEITKSNFSNSSNSSIKLPTNSCYLCESPATMTVKDGVTGKDLSICVKCNTKESQEENK